MTRDAFDRRWQIWLVVLVCTIAIAATDDSWAMALGGPTNSGVSIVAVDDDDLDDHPEHLPLPVCGSVDTTIPRSCTRKPTDSFESVHLKDGRCLRSGLRGPPVDRSNERGLTQSSWFRPRAVAAAIELDVPTAATPHNTSSEVETPADFSRNPLSGVDRYPQWVRSACESASPAVCVPGSETKVQPSSHGVDESAAHRELRVLRHGKEGL